MTMTMQDTSAAPSNMLTLKNTMPTDMQTPPTRFILFGEEWLHLQTYITQALQLPINQGSWNDKYGTFSDQAMVSNVIAAMSNVQGLAAVFGDPMALRKKLGQDPNYLFSPQPPAEIYAHIVWLANQIENAASTYNYTLSNLAPLLSPSAGTPQERADNLRMILTGDGGLVSTASDMQSKTSDLIKKLTDFDGKITDANTQLANYVGQSSQILADANQLIGKYQDDIQNNLRPAADEAYQKWRDFTIAAVTTSVGITILSAGLLWPVGLGLGVGLGVAAAKEKAIYNTLMDQISAENVEIQKKTRLVSDLHGLNSSITLVAPSLKTFKDNLEIIEGVWVDVGGNLAYIANNYGVDQLSSLPWITQAMKIGDATKKWQDIEDTTKQYTQHSLVSYDTGTQWGAKIADAA